MVSGNLIRQVFSLEDYLANPPDGMEWVNCQLVEKHPMECMAEGNLPKNSGSGRSTRSIREVKGAIAPISSR